MRAPPLDHPLPHERPGARESLTPVPTLLAPDRDLKPPELQSLIENFCLGTRRLHLYGSAHSLRRGWLTLSAPTAAPRSGVFSRESVVHPVEREGTASEQQERWGAPREWTRDEWEARWKKPGMPVTTVGGGGAGAGSGSSKVGSLGPAGVGAEKVQRVDSLLPYVEGQSRFPVAWDPRSRTRCPRAPS